MSLPYSSSNPLSEEKQQECIDAGKQSESC
jgi:hypothetical protein